jgi:hypothetical protein
VEINTLLGAIFMFEKRVWKIHKRIVSVTKNYFQLLNTPAAAAAAGTPVSSSGAADL